MSDIISYGSLQWHMLKCRDISEPETFLLKYNVSKRPTVTSCILGMARCAKLKAPGRFAKAALPMHERRQEQQELVRAFVAKRPAQSTKAPRRKRTPFSLKREGS